MTRRKAAKNPVALSTHRKIFVDLLNKIAAGGQSRWNIFTDFLALSAISLAACDKYGLLTDKETLDERKNATSKSSANTAQNISRFSAKCLPLSSKKCKPTARIT